MVKAEVVWADGCRRVVRRTRGPDMCASASVGGRSVVEGGLR